MSLVDKVSPSKYVLFNFANKLFSNNVTTEYEYGCDCQGNTLPWNVFR